MTSGAEYRVEELGERAGLSVEVIRSYQSKGLLPPPRHVGRLALYGPRHLERLKTIRDLKARGHSLRAIAAMLADAPRPAARGDITDAVLASENETLTLVELAERTRTPPAMLRSLEGSGIIRPHTVGGERRYTSADVRAVRMLLSLLGSGLPMEEFMRVARVQLEAADAVAEGAVDLFLRYVREPLLASNVPAREEADRLVAGFRLMLQAVTELLAYNVQRTVLSKLQDEIQRTGSRSERAAFDRELVKRGARMARPA